MKNATHFLLTRVKRLILVGLFLVPLQPLNAQPTSTCSYLSAGKLKIYYCEQGVGSAVVLIHPGFLDLHAWDKLVDSISKNHRVIRIDLPGHGQTIGRDTSIQIAEVIKQVMNRLGVRSASFVGVSLGASCVMDFAIAHPEMTNSIVLCSPGLNGWEDVIKTDSLSKRVFVRSDTYFNTPDPELVVSNYVHYWLDGPYRETATVDAATRAYVTNTAFEKLKRTNAVGPVFNKRKAAKRVQMIRKRVLILYGAMDIPFTAQVSRYLAKKIKGAKIVVVEEAAHFLMLEKPILVSLQINGWVK